MNANSQVPELVLWEACVRTHPLADQLAATVAGGFDAMSMPPHVVQRRVAEGISVAQMRSMAEDLGVCFSDLDGGVGFMPIRLPTGATERLIRRFDIPLEETLDIANALGVRRMCVVGIFDYGTYTLEEMIDGFGKLCDTAAERDLTVNLEPMAFFGVQDVLTASKIISGAARTNAGIVFDTWHFTRITNHVGALAALANCGWIDMQVDDGPRELAGATMMEDSTDYRMFPGEGDFALVDQIRAVDVSQLRSIGVEVFSREADRLPAVEAGRRAGVTLRKVAAHAGLVLPELVA
jgi:sugar phosphate isomerase/epimerase